MPEYQKVVWSNSNGTVFDGATAALQVAIRDRLPSTLLNGGFRVTTFGNTGGLSNKSGTITTGGAAQQIASSNSDRRYFLFQNLSTDDLWINFGSTAVANQPSIRIAAGEKFIIDGTFVCNELVSVIGATTGQAYTCKEA